MKKEVKFFCILLATLLLLPFITSSSVEDEIQRITYYAEEYETGNIDYVKLLVYSSSVREKLNEILGSITKVHGGLLKKDEIRNILGPPTDETKWVWVEGEEHEIKLDEPVPIWEKIVFDGKKIQIRLEVHPTIFKKNWFYEEYKNYNEEYEIKEKEEMFGKEFGFDEEGMALIYRLHFNIEFKRPQEQLDIISKIDEIKNLAEIFNSNPTQQNAESLAKESVNAEMAFSNNFRQGAGKCEQTMNSVLGSENMREIQKLLVEEISFYEGDNFETIMRLEMCDDCEWNWINLNIWLEGRGPGFKFPKDVNDLDESESRKRFENMDWRNFEAETIELIDEIKRFLDIGDYGSALSYSNKLQMLTEVWNQKANDVWEEADKKFNELDLFENIDAKEERDPYYWIEREIEKRDYVKQLRQQNYEKRKNFYLSIFAPYEKKEFYYEQTEWEKRLIEEFREFGEEICDNNVDDNNNKQIDCADAQCGGKFCGELVSVGVENNETFEEVTKLYCIAGECRQKEEIIIEKKFVCGNHICEGNETLENCAEDCTLCPEHPPLNCSGKVIFKGKDQNGCALEPVCIEETETCVTNKDCIQPLCGITECVYEHEVDEKGKCEVTDLQECKPPECRDGEKQITLCNTGEEITTAICGDGIWMYMHIACPSIGEKVCCGYPGPADESLYEWRDSEKCKSPEDSEFPEKIVDDSYCEEEKMSCRESCMDFFSVSEPACKNAEMKISGTYPNCNCEWVCEEIVGEECGIKEDCGNPQDVCSNGKCITIPQIVQIEPEKIKLEFPEKEIIEKEIEIEEEKVEQEEIIEEQETEESVQEQTPESEETIPTEIPETTKTGGVIFSFFRLLTERITGRTITSLATIEGETKPEPIPEPIPESEPSLEPLPKSAECPDAGKPPETGENCWYEKTYDEKGCVSGYDVKCREWEEDKEGEREEWERHDREEREENCNRECKRTCEDRLVMPCVNKCVFGERGEEEIGDLESCKSQCEGEIDIDNCVSDCVSNCLEGKWEEFEKQFEEGEEHKEEKGVFKVGGMCRKEEQRKEAFIYFDGWGEPFEKLHEIKNKYYKREGDWCKWEIENLIKQRKEFEKGFNEQFAKWFFEKYLVNSAEDWEQHMSGIFELYWRNVEIQMRLSHAMRCLDKRDITEIYNPELINFKYNTEYGSVEYWEELKEIKMPELDERVTIISPYMKVWIFPHKKFIIYEMKKSMENHEFPGPPEDKIERENEQGPTAEEREFIKQDESFMKNIREISEKYNGNLQIAGQFIDYETNDVVFNVYVQINEDDIIKMQPMLPEEVPEKDVTLSIDFDTVYDLIYTMEKEMRGEEIESPPWDRKPRKGIKKITSEIKMFFKVRGIINSAEVSPKEAEKDIKSISKIFFKMMMKSDKGPSEEEIKEMEERGRKDELTEEDMRMIKEKEIFESKEEITGQIIRNN